MKTSLLSVYNNTYNVNVGIGYNRWYVVAAAAAALLYILLCIGDDNDGPIRAHQLTHKKIVHAVQRVFARVRFIFIIYECVYIYSKTTAHNNNSNPYRTTQ